MDLFAQVIKCKIHKKINKERLTNNDTLVIIPPYIGIDEMEKYKKFEKVKGSKDKNSIYCYSADFIGYNNKPEVVNYYKSWCYSWYKICLSSKVHYNIADIDSSDQKIILSELKKFEKSLIDSSTTLLKIPESMANVLSKYSKKLCLLTDIVERSYIDKTFSIFPVVYLYQVFILDINNRNIYFYNSYRSYQRSTDYSIYNPKKLAWKSNLPFDGGLQFLFKLLKSIKK